MSIPLIKSLPDLILDEIHATRRKLLQEHGGIAGLFAFLRKEEAKSQLMAAEPEDAKAQHSVPPRQRNAG